MKLINIYLIGQIYICNIYIRSTSPIKYIPWNNEIISWGLCWLCMDVWVMLLDIEDIGVWEWLWSVVEKLGIVYGIVIVVCLIYNLLPQQNKKNN